MPARHLGFSKGSAASLQALLPPDFVVPVSALPGAARRQYARLAVQEVQVYDAPQTPEELARLRWDERTGEAVGEGSSAGATRASAPEDRTNGDAMSRRRAEVSGYGLSRGASRKESAQPRKSPRPTAPSSAPSASTSHAGPDTDSNMPRTTKARRQADLDTRPLKQKSQKEGPPRSPQSGVQVHGDESAKPSTDSTKMPTGSLTLSQRLFGFRAQSASTPGTASPASSVSKAPSIKPVPAPTTSRSFTHKHLSQRDRDPPAASAIFDHLSERQSLASPRALTPLIDYSRRTGHYYVQLRAGEVRARLASQYRIVGDEGVYGYDRQSGEGMKGQTLGVKAWAGKAYPPRRYSLPLDVTQALRNLHYRLISVKPKNPAPRPVEVVDQLRNLCDSEGRGRDGLIEALSAMLNLYMIYAERSLGPGSALTTLGRVLALCPEILPTKQTLHLLVQGILWPKELDYTGSLFPADDHDAALPKRTRVPSDSPDVRSRLEDVLDRFQTKYSVVPGTETFRNMLIFASMTDDPVLANVAFDGWWIADAAVSSLTPGEGDQARFLHRAKRWRKFRHVLRMLKLRGWVRTVVGEETTRRERYAWCGPSERGADDVIGWEEMSAEEQADVRSKREKWAARDKKKIAEEDGMPERDLEAELARRKIARAREKRKKRPGAGVGDVPRWREGTGLDADGEGASEEEGGSGAREEVWW